MGGYSTLYGGRQVSLIPRHIWCHVLAASFSISLIATPVLFLTERHTIANVQTMRLESVAPSNKSPGVMVQAAKTRGPDNFYPGEVIKAVLDITEYRNCDGVVRRFLVTNVNKPGELSKVYHFEDSDISHQNDQLPSMKTLEMSFRIPIDAEPGTAVYHRQVTRWCNVLQKYLWPIQDKDETMAFEITETNISK